MDTEGIRSGIENTQLGSYAARSTNKVSELGGYTPRSPGGELDTFGRGAASDRVLKAPN